MNIDWDLVAISVTAYLTPSLIFAGYVALLELRRIRNSP